jgi:ketosteroid isomerase-like protein
MIVDVTTDTDTASGAPGSTAHPARHAIEQHAARWNARDRTAWLELFADEVVFEDPVGKAPKPGRAAAEGSWDNSFREGRVWTLHPERIVPGGPHEAVVLMRNEGDVHGEHAVVESIEVWKVRDDGRVVHVRAFFEQPTDVELDPYFQP